MVRQNTIFLLAPLFALVPAANGQLVSQAGEGQRLRRTYEIESTMELVESQQSFNGEATSDGELSKNRRQTSKRRVFTAIDEVRGASDGVPTDFVRTYEGLKGKRSIHEKMSSEMEAGGARTSRNFETELKSILADESVRFERRDEAWTKNPAEGSALNANQVEGLEQDLSLQFLLPQDKVRPGSTWKVAGADLNRLLLAGDDLHFLEVKEEEDVLRSTMMMRVPMDPTKGEWEGSLSLTHKGEKRIRGRKVVLINIEVDTKMTTVATFDMGDAAGQAPDGGQMMMPGGMSTKYVTRRQGKGVLHFDPELKQVVHLNLELEVHETASESTSMSMPGMGASEIQSTEVSEGEFRIGFSASAL